MQDTPSCTASGPWPLEMFFGPLSLNASRAPGRRRGHQHPPPVLSGHAASLTRNAIAPHGDSLNPETGIARHVLGRGEAEQVRLLPANCTPYPTLLLLLLLLLLLQ